MSRVAHCQACSDIITGRKSRLSIEHTCGKTTAEIIQFMTEQKEIKNRLFADRFNRWKPEDETNTQGSKI